MVFVSDYYNILGIKQGATVADIKTAYRRKAKLLHPDRNKSPYAQRDFIVLTEAYEYLLANPGASARQSNSYYNHTVYTSQKDVGRRSSRDTNKQQRDFVTKNVYDSGDALNTLGAYVYLLLIAFVLAGIAFAATAIAGPIGFLAGALIFYGGLRISIRLAQANSDIEWPALQKAFKHIVAARWVLVAVVTVFNLYVFLKPGLQTLIPLKLLAELYLLFVIVPWVVLRVWMKKQRSFKNLVITFCLSPLVLSAFFMLNFLFSHNPEHELYAYQLHHEPSGTEARPTTLIVLPGNAYGCYPGIRMFLDPEQLQGTDYVNYTFKTGLFGIRVMSDWEFGLAQPY